VFECALFLESRWMPFNLLSCCNYDVEESVSAQFYKCKIMMVFVCFSLLVVLIF
jgi:hypothetical protein